VVHPRLPASWASTLYGPVGRASAFLRLDFLESSTLCLIDPQYASGSSASWLAATHASKDSYPANGAPLRREAVEGSAFLASLSRRHAPNAPGVECRSM